MKTVPFIHEPPQKRQPYPQRLYRVPNSDGFDHHISLAERIAKGLCRVGRRTRFIVAIRSANIADRRVIWRQKPHHIDHTGKRTHRISPPRIPDQDDLVTRAIARRQRPVSPPDLLVDAASNHNVPRAAPIAPLDARFIEQRHVLGMPDLTQQLIGQAGIRLASRLQRRHRPVKNNDMGRWPTMTRANFGMLRTPSE